ncbi:MULTISPECIES: TPM domain-containing protein [Enterococcus]|uniref:TPM domain-containing protein n=1 Tax=Enterococcus TaxID=1350 RepID=UPI00065E3C02|nr:hypothetical protein BAU16_09815 [Enterococcus sp. JM9B]
MKKLGLLLFGIVASLLFAHPAIAASDLVEDDAQLFTDSQITQLNETATKIGETIKGNVFIVTTYDNQEEPRDFADDYLREKVGNNQNGAVLLLDMNQRQIYISTSGNMIDYLTDRRIDTILDALETEMGDENYFEAAKTYLEKTETFVAEGVPGGHYRVDEETGKITRYKVITPLEIGIAVAAALVASIAFFLVTKSTYQLKRGGYTYAYHENADVQLTKKENRLVHSFVTTRRIPKNNNSGGGFGGGSTTHSSGGGTFGGGGRGF